jgi:hypothetical protein
MRYERPAIEERVDVKALLGIVQVSGGAGDEQPIWRRRDRRDDPSSTGRG